MDNIQSFFALEEAILCVGPNPLKVHDRKTTFGYWLQICSVESDEPVSKTRTYEKFFRESKVDDRVSSEFFVRMVTDI